MTLPISDSLSLILGLAVLLGSAELLVRAAVRLASASGKSRLVIGLTIAAFGTSAPELAIGAVGVLTDSAQVGFGNVVGSNIFNILFVLGLAALIRPIVISRRVVWCEIPMLLGIGLIFHLLLLDGHLQLWDAAILVAVLIGYLVYVSRLARTPDEASLPERSQNPGPAGGRGSLAKPTLTIVVSLALLALGSHWMVTGAHGLAMRFGISDLVVGLTIVAVGTSLPEIATTLAAVRQREYDLAVGNVLGSCVFNIVAVPAVMSLVHFGALPIDPGVVRLDVPIMLATFVACLPIFFSGHRISRTEGVLFLLYYVVYGTVLYLRTSHSPTVAEYGPVLAWIGIPIVATTLVLVTVRAICYGRGRATIGESS